MDRNDVVNVAYDIAQEYQGNLTIRQLYYQFVARGLFVPDENDRGKLYGRLVSIISKARLSGNFPFEWIVDRTRTVHKSDHFTDYSNVDLALTEAEEYIRDMPLLTLNRAMWFGQQTYVIVGVEKEALAGVFQTPCDNLGVGLFVFRGYSSISSLYQLAIHLEAAANVVDNATILYFGDHDPDGWEIPRAAQRTLYTIAHTNNMHLPKVSWERIALTMDQIKQYSPPPFFAKDSSSRYNSYVQEHSTKMAWELDALKPQVLQTLITSSISRYWDEETHQENLTYISYLRKQMKEKMTHEWLINTLSK